jgi:nucleoside-diphosphate-sugar epimerase
MKGDKMRILVAGAAGAVGKRLVPVLVQGGHEVVAMTRSPQNRPALVALGAEPVIADGLDRDAVIGAVAASEPEVIVHQMTALAGLGNLKHFDREFALTNRLRTEGTDHLLSAARAAGVRQFVAASYTSWPYAREGKRVKTEEDPLDPTPPAEMSETLAAIRHLENAVTSAEGLAGVVLRYGAFYGPGTSMTPGGDTWETIRGRKFPVIGNGAGIWSFIHIDDVATATTAAIEGAATGIYNIVDDDPAPVAEWLPAAAQLMGAKPPRRVPVWIGRLAAGEPIVSLSTSVRGAANGKAKRELDWVPRYASWREGFRALAEDARTPAAA